MILHLQEGDKNERTAVIKRLVGMQYERHHADFRRGVFRVRGDTIDIFPAENADLAVRIELADDVIEALFLFDPLTGRRRRREKRFTVYPSSHYVRRAVRWCGQCAPSKKNWPDALKICAPPDGSMKLGACRKERFLI